MSVIPVSALPGAGSYGGTFGQLGTRLSASQGGRFGQLGSRNYAGGYGDSDSVYVPSGVGPAIRAGLGPTHPRPQFSDGTQKHSLPQQMSFKRQLLDIIALDSVRDVNQNQPLWGQATMAHVHSQRPPEPLRIYLPDKDEPYPTPFVPIFVGRNPPVHGARAGRPNPALLRGGSLYGETHPDDDSGLWPRSDKELLEGGALSGGVRRCKKYSRRKCVRITQPNKLGNKYCAKYTRRKCKKSFETGRALRRRGSRRPPAAAAAPGPGPGPGPDLPRLPPPPRPPEGKRGGPARPPAGADDGMGPDRPPARFTLPAGVVTPAERKYREIDLDIDRHIGYGPNWGYVAPAFQRYSQPHYGPYANPLPPDYVPVASLPRLGHRHRRHRPTLPVFDYPAVANPFEAPAELPPMVPRDYEGPIELKYPDIPNEFHFQAAPAAQGHLAWNQPSNPGGLIPADVDRDVVMADVPLADAGVIQGSFLPQSADVPAPAINGNFYLPPVAAQGSAPAPRLRRRGDFPEFDEYELKQFKRERERGRRPREHKEEKEGKRPGERGFRARRPAPIGVKPEDDPYRYNPRVYQAMTPGMRAAFYDAAESFDRPLDTPLPDLELPSPEAAEPRTPRFHAAPQRRGRKRSRRAAELPPPRAIQGRDRRRLHFKAKRRKVGGRLKKRKSSRR